MTPHSVHTPGQTSQSTSDRPSDDRIRSLLTQMFQSIGNDKRAAEAGELTEEQRAYYSLFTVPEEQREKQLFKFSTFSLLSDFIGEYAELFNKEFSTTPEKRVLLAGVAGGFMVNVLAVTEDFETETQNLLWDIEATVNRNYSDTPLRINTLILNETEFRGLPEGSILLFDTLTTPHNEKGS